MSLRFLLYLLVFLIVFFLIIVLLVILFFTMLPGFRLLYAILISNWFLRRVFLLVFVIFGFLFLLQFLLFLSLFSNLFSSNLEVILWVKVLAADIEEHSKHNQEYHSS